MCLCHRCHYAIFILSTNVPILLACHLCCFRTYDRMPFLSFVAFLPAPFFFFNCAVLACDLLVCTIFSLHPPSPPLISDSPVSQPRPHISGSPDEYRAATNPLLSLTQR